MIVIDQRQIDNSYTWHGHAIADPFPRGQEWWTRFMGVGTTATVRDDGTVTLEPDGRHYDYVTWMADPDHHGKDCPIAQDTLTAAQKRKAETALRERLHPLLAAAVVDEPQSA